MSSEQVTLAQELHDGIAQELVALGFSIDSVISSQTDEKSRAQLRPIRFEISALIEKTRREIHQLRTASEPISSALAGDLSYELQKVISEVVRNIQQHSQATSMSIVISDNGVGGAREKSGSFGLLGIRERIARLHGETLIESDHSGTKIVATIRLDKNDTSSNR